MKFILLIAGLAGVAASSVAIARFGMKYAPLTVGLLFLFSLITAGSAIRVLWWAAKEVMRGDK